ncbi:cytochrome P450 CYP72A219-like protein [Tanacetum coccineum]
MIIPSGVKLALPTIYLHREHEMPAIFSKGISNATNGKGISPFTPFASGPRVCIGRKFASTEAKIAIAMILQRFSFELSPLYKHSQFPGLTLSP